MEEKDLQVVEEKQQDSKPQYNKFSQMPTENVADAFLRIAPDIESLINDQEVRKIFAERKTPNNEAEEQKLGFVVVMKLAIYILKSKRDVAFNIVGAMNNKTVEEIKKQSFITTLHQLTTVLTDGELIGFFTLAARSVSGMFADM